MPRRTSFVPKNTPKGWRINIPGKYTESGDRERQFYPTRQAALEASKRLKDKRDRHGDTAKAISPALAEQAIAAEKLLQPYGVSILEAARRAAEAEARNQASVPAERAFAAFETAKEHLSTKQTQAIAQMGKKFVPEFTGRLMSTITSADIEELLAKTTGTNSMFNSRLRVTITFWRWCGHPSRRWCDPETLKHTERKDEVAGEIGTLTPAQAETLLRTAERHYPDAVIGFAIALFTGIRQAEIERLKPEDFKADGIEVPVDTNRKSKRRRFIQMPEPLAAWLKAYPIKKRVLPANWRRKEMTIRRLAGWKVWTDLVQFSEEEQKAAEDLPEWPQNALRHTAASAALAIGKPIETLIFEHGHSEGVKTLKAHYIGRMTKADAEAIQNIRPELIPYQPAKD